MRKDIVPDSEAQSEGEAVEKARLEPLVDPEQVGDVVVFEVLVEIGQGFLEQAVKDLELFQKQFKAAGIKSI